MKKKNLTSDLGFSGRKRVQISVNNGIDRKDQNAFDLLQTIHPLGEKEKEQIESSQHGTDR